MTLPPVVVFDLDGTLVDTAEDIAAALNHCLQVAGHPAMSVAEVRSRVGLGARVLIRRALAAYDVTDPAEVERLLCVFGRSYAAGIADASRPYDGVLEALEQLKRDGLRLAVCTNKPERLARLLLDRLEMSHFFAGLTGGDSFAFSKPDPRHLLETLTQIGGNPADAVLVGDSPVDMETGMAANVPTVAVSFGFAGTPDGATIVIDHYRELPGALRQAHKAR
jgi:phosphoglycolate phosphatase